MINFTTPLASVALVFLLFQPTVQRKAPTHRCTDVMSVKHVELSDCVGKRTSTTTVLLLDDSSSSWPPIDRIDENGPGEISSCGRQMLPASRPSYISLPGLSVFMSSVMSCQL